MLKLQTKIGNMALVVEGDEPKELFKQLGFFANLPCSCGHCHEEKIVPSHRNIKGFDFYFLKCLNPECGYEFAFGQTKEGGHLFPKNEWKAPYQRGDAQPEEGGNDAWD